MSSRSVRRRVLPGLLMVLASAWPFTLGVREWHLARTVGSKWDIDRLDPPEAEIGSVKVVVRDNVRGLPGSDKVVGPIETVVAGVSYSLPSPVIVRSTRDGMERYWHWVAVALVTERVSGTSKIVVVQRLDPNLGIDMPLGKRQDDTEFRTLLVSESGDVSEDRFHFPERSRPPLRAKFAGMVYPSLIGYTTQLFTGWPTVFFPILFPVLTMLTGVALVLSGGISVALGPRH